jgi:hypothetical protein
VIFGAELASTDLLSGGASHTPSIPLRPRLGLHDRVDSGHVWRKDFSTSTKIPRDFFEVRRYDVWLRSNPTPTSFRPP